MEYLSLKEYQDIAKKILNGTFPRIAQFIIKDEDKFGEVVNSIIMADWKFNGKGNLFGYRKQRVKWTVLGFLIQKTDLSLNFNITDTIELSETIADKLTYDNIEEEDSRKFLRNKVTNSKVLTEREKICISQYLTEDGELSNIADALDIHKEAVKTSIRRGLSKLGLYNGYIERFERRKDSRRKSKDATRTNGISV